MNRTRKSTGDKIAEAILVTLVTLPSALGVVVAFAWQLAPLFGH